MPSIDVDFAVWKALTALRRDEAHSYNDVLRALLDLPACEASEAISGTDQEEEGCYLSGRWMPNGTQLRAQYKGRTHEATIRSGQLTDAEGLAHSSASAAAKAVTSTNVNGLMFWSVKRPGDETWRRLGNLPKRW